MSLGLYNSLNYNIVPKDPDVTKAMILRKILLGNDMRKNLMYELRKEGFSKNQLNYHIGDKVHGLKAMGILKEKNMRFIPQKNFKALLQTVKCLLSDIEVKDYVKGSLVHWVSEAYDSPHGDLALTGIVSEFVEKGKHGTEYGFVEHKLGKIFDLARPWTLEPENILKITRGSVDLEFCIAYFLVCWDMQGTLVSRRTGMGPDYAEVNARMLFNEHILDRASGKSWESISRDVILFGYRRLVLDPIRAYRDKIELSPEGYTNYLSQYYKFKEESELKDFNERLKFLLNVALNSALEDLKTDGVPRQDKIDKEYEF